MTCCTNCISYDYCSARRMCINPPFGYCTRYQPKRMSSYSLTMSTRYGAKMDEDSGSNIKLDPSLISEEKLEITDIVGTYKGDK